MRKESAVAIAIVACEKSRTWISIFIQRLTNVSGSTRYVSMHVRAYVRERRFAVAGWPPRDADMNGMRCYYRSVPTDNSLRRGFAERREVGKKGECSSTQEVKGRNSRRIAFAENRTSVHSKSECNRTRIFFVFLSTRAFF